MENTVIAASPLDIPVRGCDYQGHEFGASYPDSVCIDGYLWDADSGDACEDGWCYTIGGEIPCPKCNAEAYAEYHREDDEYQNAVQAAAGGITQTAIE